MARTELDLGYTDAISPNSLLFPCKRAWQRKNNAATSRLRAAAAKSQAIYIHNVFCDFDILVDGVFGGFSLLAGKCGPVTCTVAREQQHRAERAERAGRNSPQPYADRQP